MEAFSFMSLCHICVCFFLSFEGSVHTRSVEKVASHMKTEHVRAVDSFENKQNREAYGVI